MSKPLIAKLMTWNRTGTFGLVMLPNLLNQVLSLQALQLRVTKKSRNSRSNNFIFQKMQLIARSSSSLDSSVEICR